MVRIDLGDLVIAVPEETLILVAVVLAIAAWATMGQLVQDLKALVNGGKMSYEPAHKWVENTPRFEETDVDNVYHDTREDELYAVVGEDEVYVLHDDTPTQNWDIKEKVE
jgi:hypothetical protein